MRNIESLLFLLLLFGCSNSEDKLDSNPSATLDLIGVQNFQVDSNFAEPFSFAYHNKKFMLLSSYEAHYYTYKDSPIPYSKGKFTIDGPDGIGDMGYLFSAIETDSQTIFVNQNTQTMFEIENNKVVKKFNLVNDNYVILVNNFIPIVFLNNKTIIPLIQRQQTTTILNEVPGFLVIDGNEKRYCCNYPKIYDQKYFGNQMWPYVPSITYNTVDKIYIVSYPKDIQVQLYDENFQFIENQHFHPHEMKPIKPLRDDSKMRFNPLPDRSLEEMSYLRCSEIFMSIYYNENKNIYHRVLSSVLTP